MGETPSDIAIPISSHRWGDNRFKHLRQPGYAGVNILRKVLSESTPSIVKIGIVVGRRQQ